MSASTIVWHHPEFGECALTREIDEIEVGFGPRLAEGCWPPVWTLQVAGCEFRRHSPSGSWCLVEYAFQGGDPTWRTTEDLPELCGANALFGPVREPEPEPDILDKIDEAIAPRCAYCNRPLPPDGPSDEFCREECQRRWLARSRRVSDDEDDPLEGTASAEFERLERSHSDVPWVEPSLWGSAEELELDGVRGPCCTSTCSRCGEVWLMLPGTPGFTCRNCRRMVGHHPGCLARP